MLNQNNSTKLRRPAIHGGITTTARLLGERMEEMALHLLGTPNKKLSSRDELRFGNRGSMSVNIGGAEPGIWFDHEAAKGGGVWSLMIIIIIMHILLLLLLSVTIVQLY